MGGLPCMSTADTLLVSFFPYTHRLDDPSTRMTFQHPRVTAVLALLYLRTRPLASLSPERGLDRCAGET